VSRRDVVDVSDRDGLKVDRGIGIVPFSIDCVPISAKKQLQSLRTVATFFRTIHACLASEAVTTLLPACDMSHLEA